MNQLQKFFTDFYKDKKEKKSTIQSGVIVTLTKQDSSSDYYDIEIDGKIFKDVPCPIPTWLDIQLKLNNSITGIFKDNFGYIITDKRTVELQRKPLFNEGDSVNVFFEDNMRSMAKITLERSVKKYVKVKIIYV